MPRGVFKSSAKFTEKNLCWGIFFNIMLEKLETELSFIKSLYFKSIKNILRSENTLKLSKIIFAIIFEIKIGKKKILIKNSYKNIKKN